MRRLTFGVLILSAARPALLYRRQQASSATSPKKGAPRCVQTASTPELVKQRQAALCNRAPYEQQ